jgi:sugar/nucleoside kinase (ribokinase family)
MPANLAPLGIVGNLNVDQWVQTVTRFPRWDEEIVVDSSRIAFAGTAGYMLLATEALGLPGFVVSTIGDDYLGTFLQEELKRIGADSTGVEIIPGGETCLGIIFVGPEGQRSIMAVLGVHEVMDADIAWKHDAGIAQCPEVMICGSFVLPRFGPAAALPYARELRARGQTVAFDPSWDPGGWGDEVRRATMSLLAEVDIFLPNEHELIGLTGAIDLPGAIATIRERPKGPRELVIKRGADGATFVSCDEEVSVPGFSIEPINTIGAGDVFDVGYLYARRLGWLPAERLRFACALAGMVVSQRGERVYPLAEAVNAFIQSQGEGDAL